MNKRGLHRQENFSLPLPKKAQPMKSKIILHIDLSSSLLQREFERLFMQSEGFAVEQAADLVFTDRPENYKDDKIGVIDFNSFSFPVDFLSLKTVIESASLKKAQAEGKIVSIGSMIEIDRYERILRLTPNDAEVPLTEKEISILDMLYKQEGKTVSKEDLLQQVWRYHAQSETHTVETHIYRLRQKLEKIIGGEELILTDNNGYRLNEIYLD